MKNLLTVLVAITALFMFSCQDSSEDVFKDIDTEMLIGDVDIEALVGDVDIEALVGDIDIEA